MFVYVFLPFILGTIGDAVKSSENYISQSPLLHFTHPTILCAVLSRKQGRRKQRRVDPGEKLDHNHAETSCKAIHNDRSPSFTLWRRTRKGEMTSWKQGYCTECVVVCARPCLVPQPRVSFTWRSCLSFDKSGCLMLRNTTEVDTGTAM